MTTDNQQRDSLDSVYYATRVATEAAPHAHFFVPDPNQSSDPYERDAFDINDEIVLCHPALYAGTKYLHFDVQVEAWRAFLHQQTGAAA